jgi:hypothetical protein
MESLPTYININEGTAYLQCGAYEDGWWVGYFDHAHPIITKEAPTLYKCIKDMKDLLAIRELVNLPSTVME